jgi:signal transduction histidine kinase
MNLKMTRFNNLSIKWKLLIICVLLVSVPVIAAGSISYKSAEHETFRQIEERLQEQAVQTKMFVSSVHSEIQTKKEAVTTQAQSMVESQAQAVYSFITKWKGSNDDLVKAIDDISVGETGYIWVVDYDGITVTTKNKDLVGTDMSSAEDANGKLFIQ